MANFRYTILGSCADNSIAKILLQRWPMIGRLSPVPEHFCVQSPLEVCPSHLSHPSQPSQLSLLVSLISRLSALSPLSFALSALQPGLCFVLLQIVFKAQDRVLNMLIVQTYHFFLLLQIAWSTHPIVNILCHSAFMLKIQCDCNGI